MKRMAIVLIVVSLVVVAWFGLKPGKETPLPVVRDAGSEQLSPPALQHRTYRRAKQGPRQAKRVSQREQRQAGYRLAAVAAKEPFV